MGETISDVPSEIPPGPRTEQAPSRETSPRPEMGDIDNSLPFLEATRDAIDAARIFLVVLASHAPWNGKVATILAILSETSRLEYLLRETKRRLSQAYKKEEEVN